VARPSGSVSGVPASGSSAASPTGPQAAPPPKRTSEQIRADMDRQRRELADSVDHLRERVTEITDWRSQIKKHRRAIVIGAVATGFVVGGMMALRRR
jgi:dienelactone hydrolase